MVGSEFINLFKSVQQGTIMTIEDFSDQINLFTVVIILLATIIVTVKQYLLNSISCYIPVEPSGKDFGKFLTDYCWVTGTIPLRTGERTPSNIEWEEYDRLRKINFFNLFQTYARPYKLGLIDLSDSINLISVVLLSILSTVIAAKQYLFNSISCFIPVAPNGGNDFDDYLRDYCWVHGTIPFRPNEKLPKSDTEWELYDNTRRINYYQWVPFVLGLQCILFYVPHIAWQAICSQRAGGDLFSLVQAASNAATQPREARQGSVNQVAEFLEDMIEGHKTCRRGRVAQWSDRAYKACGMCVVSKRLGTCLVMSYLGIKALTIVNAALQIYLIQRFLGFYEGGSYSKASMQLGTNVDQKNPKTTDIIPYGEDDISGFGFGLMIANYIRTGRDWPETLLFPRVAYCRVPGIRIVGGDNAYTAQCALPINMLNEKIYIFLWFWIVFVLCVCSASLLLWLSRLLLDPQRKNFIKRFLRSKHVKNMRGDMISRRDLDAFIDGYLRRDGVFLIRMMAINAGEVITSEIVAKIYGDYIHDYGSSESSVLTTEYPAEKVQPNQPGKIPFQSEIV